MECGQPRGRDAASPLGRGAGPRGGTPEVPVAAAVGAARATPFPPNCREGENQLEQTQLLTLQGGRIPSPRGQLRWGVSQMPLLLQHSEGDCASTCVIRDPYIQWQGPVKLSKALPCKIITYFFSRLKGKMEGYLIWRERSAAQPWWVGMGKDQWACSNQCNPQFESTTEIHAVGKQPEEPPPDLLVVHVEKWQHSGKHRSGPELITWCIYLVWW